MSRIFLPCGISKSELLIIHGTYVPDLSIIEPWTNFRLKKWLITSLFIYFLIIRHFFFLQPKVVNLCVGGPLSEPWTHNTHNVFADIHVRYIVNDRMLCEYVCELNLE